MDLAQHLARPHARVGQLETVTPAQAPARAEHRFGQSRLGPLGGDQMPVVEVLGKPEDHPVAIRRIVDARRAPALERSRSPRRRTPCRSSRDRAARSRRARRASSTAEPDQIHAVRQVPASRTDSDPSIETLDHLVVVGRPSDVRAAFQQRQRAAADEVDLEAEEIVLGTRLLGDELSGAIDREQPRRRSG